ncbi:MAG: endonuclease MutS2 [Lachnospiraceae bacterium]|nr:endonuclease MutS2 [Lachnospiraceae bacterium]
MNKKNLRTLEYNKIIEMLSEHASTEPGKNRVLSLMPESSAFEIDRMQQNTEDAVNRILREGSVSFNARSNMKECVSRLRKGSNLSAAELLSIALLLENVLRVKSYGQTKDDTRDSLSDLFECLMPLSPVCKEIRRCILSEDEIADDASSTLHSIRRKQKNVNDKIHSQLSKMVNDTYRSYLQDSVITMRDGRYCIPVRSEHKGSVPGMIHDQSASASTFFIEPAAIVSLNNDLRQLEIEEANEIEVILSSLSDECRDNADMIDADFDTIVELDFIFAKAAFALELGASRPVYNDKGIIKLKKARHPLLPKESAVPIDICLGEDYTLLVVTGPNTGGKTVSLKTVGLLTLMGQAGLHIPAADKSELSIFDDVYADIGDEQSIEQSLSTFSSHMKNIVEILGSATDKSLCLFDELGAGTDPVEGAALAISILDTLHRKNIRTMATTHYSELKIYALSTEGVENAGCEFDVESLRPTYRLLTGIPGKSNAFEISRKLGLPDTIIDKARQQISENDSSFEDVIAQLEKDRITIEENRREIELYKHDIEVLKNTYEQRQDRINRAKDKILDEAREQARDILKDAKELADSTIRDINKRGGDIKQLEQNRQKLRRAIGDNGPSGTVGNNKVSRSDNKPSDFTPGVDVRIISMDLNGSVHTKPDQKGNLSVHCGIMNINTNISDLELIDAPDNKSGKEFAKKFSSSSGSLSKSGSISSEINLIGLKVDEAIPKLDKYLDDAYLSHLLSVRIVHGKGTGALRSAISQHLKKISYVDSFRAGEFGEGDAGVTIVNFK